MAFPHGSNPQKPAIAELEELLKEEGHRNVHINPDGSVTVHGELMTDTPTPPATPPAHKGHSSQPWKGPDYPKNKIAEPTIGRMVYVYHDKEPSPMAAQVAFAEAGSLEINAMVVAQSGDIILGGLQHVPHVSERVASLPFYWDWMPFQKGQQAKTEQLQNELDKALDAKGPTAFSGQGSSGAIDGGNPKGYGAPVSNHLKEIPMTTTVTVSVPAGNSLHAEVLQQTPTIVRTDVAPGETKSFTVTDVNRITSIREK